MSTAQSQASPSLADRDAKAQLQLTTLGGVAGLRHRR
jgi:hypothetical protein